MFAYNCTQLITRPAWITDRSATLLEHIGYTLIISKCLYNLELYFQICLTTCLHLSFCFKQKYSSVTLRYNYKYRVTQKDAYPYFVR